MFYDFIKYMLKNLSTIKGLLNVVINHELLVETYKSWNIYKLKHIKVENIKSVSLEYMMSYISKLLKNTWLIKGLFYSQSSKNLRIHDPENTFLDRKDRKIKG